LVVLFSVRGTKQNRYRFEVSRTLTTMIALLRKGHRGNL